MLRNGVMPMPPARKASFWSGSAGRVKLPAIWAAWMVSPGAMSPSARLKALGLR